MSRRLLLTCCLLCVAAPASTQTTIAIDVRSSFLHLDVADVAADAIAIDLAALGLLPGHTIGLECVGDWDPGPGGDTQTNLLGVFSSDATLLDRTLLHRVPGAIDAGIYNYSGPTWPSNEPTEIAEDFTIPNPGITVAIPPGATRLFVSPADIYMLDNDDPDLDLAVRITLVSTTAVLPGDAAGSRRLQLAAPNPFSAATSIAFRLEQPATVRLAVHDVSGRLVRTLAAGAMSSGSHRVTWDGLDAAGRRVPAGSYFARLDDGARFETLRMVRLR